MIPSVIVLAILPKCPICFVGMLGLLGLGSLVGAVWLHWLIVVLLGLTMAMLILDTRWHVSSKPIVVSLAGICAVTWGRLGMGSLTLFYVGIGLALSGSVWSLCDRHRSKANHVGDACPGYNCRYPSPVSCDAAWKWKIWRKRNGE